MIRVLVSRASKPGCIEEKRFKNLRELIKYMKKTYHEWVITFNHEADGKQYWARLIIYDDYIE